VRVWDPASPDRPHQHWRRWLSLRTAAGWRATPSGSHTATCHRLTNWGGPIVWRTRCGSTAVSLRDREGVIAQW